ncbi:hypothetical protein GP486_008205 [Trichoglossum hirsutum]|uniref:Glycosyl transferase CAP10 domain-containing protein n=1 Tax=Trichoglossum hirsutum TaxID=265104 RepID=A0A9P8IE51_9PEZI|nr:hypothetical protein GP486_008205 [Trichoglossum hirsutum]
MPPRPRYFGALAIAVSIFLTGFYLSRRGSVTPLSVDWPFAGSDSTSNPTAGSTAQPDPTHWHPINDLIASADGSLSSYLSKETFDLESAAAAYRERRGRHPPPGFDAWFHFAKKHGAIVVEDFWDQIYDDINPFWALPPDQMRRDVQDHNQIIHVRNREATPGTDFFWTTIWGDLVKSIQSYLPDMDIAVNPMDEPRLTVPWEDMNEYVQKERATRKMPPPSEVISEFSGTDTISSLLQLALV